MLVDVARDDPHLPSGILVLLFLGHLAPGHPHPEIGAISRNVSLLNIGGDESNFQT